MALIANAISKADLLPPNNNFISALAVLINYCMKVTAAGTLLAAVQGATTIDNLRSAIEALSVKESDRAWLRMLSLALQRAYDRRQMDATDIAAFTTVNTASATTDVLYGLCRQHDSRFTNTYNGANGGGVSDWFPLSNPAVVR